MKITCAQVVSSNTESIRRNVGENLKKASRMIAEARDAGAGLILFPEIATTGYLPDRIRTASRAELLEQYGRTCDTLAEAAAVNGLAIAAGICEVVESGAGGDSPGAPPRMYNTLRVWGNDGSVLASYRKRLLFPRSLEPELFTPGGDQVTFRLGGLTFGILICYEIRFPELSRGFIDEGVDVILVASAFPHSRVSHWRTLLEARAIENQMYVAAADHAGVFGSIRFAGHSMIVDPAGVIRAEAGEEGETCITSEVSKEMVEEVRRLLPCFEDRAGLLGRRNAG